MSRGEGHHHERCAEAQVRFELANIRRAFQTQDATEARRAFFEKRAPVFVGR